MIWGNEQASRYSNLMPYQLFTGIQLEEARDKLCQGLYRPSPVHCPLLCFHYRSVSHCLQQHINYKMEKIKVKLLLPPRLIQANLNLNCSGKLLQKYLFNPLMHNHCGTVCITEITAELCAFIKSQYSSDSKNKLIFCLTLTLLICCMVVCMECPM